MSQHEFQKALVSLIRNPVSRYKDFDRRVLDYSISSKEREQLSILASIKEFNKYGEELADQRWDKLSKNISRLLSFVDEDIIYELWLVGFEPTARKVEADLDGNSEYTIGFLNFLQTDPIAREKIEKISPEFIFDLMEYEKAEEELSKEDQNWPLPELGSCLIRTNFNVLKLNYDIPALVNEEIKPVKSNDFKYFLMIGQGRMDSVEAYEVDKKVADFLSAKKDNTPCEDLADDLHEQLAEIGILEGKRKV